MLAYEHLDHMLFQRKIICEVWYSCIYVQGIFPLESAFWRSGLKWWLLIMQWLLWQRLGKKVTWSSANWPGCPLGLSQAVEHTGHISLFQTFLLMWLFLFFRNPGYSWDHSSVRWFDPTFCLPMHLVDVHLWAQHAGYDIVTSWTSL